MNMYIFHCFIIVYLSFVSQRVFDRHFILRQLYDCCTCSADIIFVCDVLKEVPGPDNTSSVNVLTVTPTVTVTVTVTVIAFQIQISI